MADKKASFLGLTEIEKMEKIRELREDLAREVAELAAADPTINIAILFPPPSSSKSDGSWSSIGYPDVEGVVTTYLEGSSSVPVPVDAKDGPSQGRWWEDEKLYESDNVEDLKAASESMRKMILTAKKALKNKKGGGRNNNAQFKP